MSLRDGCVKWSFLVERELYHVPRIKPATHVDRPATPHLDANEEEFEKFGEHGHENHNHKFRSWLERALRLVMEFYMEKYRDSQKYQNYFLTDETEH